MFDKSKFANIIKNIKETYSSQEEFSKKTGIGRTSLSQYMNMQLDKPPKPDMLKKLAEASNGITSYYELMEICGYIDLEVVFKLKNNQDTNLCWANKGDLEDWGFKVEDINNMIYLSNSAIPDKNKQIANILQKYPSDILNKFYTKAMLQTKNLSSVMKPDINSDLLAIDIDILKKQITEATQKIVLNALMSENNVFPISDTPIKVTDVPMERNQDDLLKKIGAIPLSDINTFPIPVLRYSKSWI